MRGWFGFQRRCLARAFAGMWRLDVPFFRDMAGAFAVGSVFHLWRHGLDAVKEEWQVFLSYGLVAAGMWAVLKLLGYAIFVAPFREYEDEHNDAEWLRSLARAGNGSVSNYTHWDNVNVFPLWQAACLWAGEPPQKNSMSFHALGILNRLKASVSSFEIRLAGGQQNQVFLDDLLSEAGSTPHGIPDEATIERPSLIRAANSWGERPPFLFPESRD